MPKKDKLDKEISEYCSLNNISDVDAFKYKCMLDGFNIVRYGISPKDNINRQNGCIVDNDYDKSDKIEEPIVVKKKRKITIKNN